MSFQKSLFPQIKGKDQTTALPYKEARAVLKLDEKNKKLPGKGLEAKGNTSCSLHLEMKSQTGRRVRLWSFCAGTDPQQRHGLFMSRSLLHSSLFPTPLCCEQSSRPAARRSGSPPGFGQVVHESKRWQSSGEDGRCRGRKAFQSGCPSKPRPRWNTSQTDEEKRDPQPQGPSHPHGEGEPYFNPAR